MSFFKKAFSAASQDSTSATPHKGRFKTLRTAMLAVFAATSSMPALPYSMTHSHLGSGHKKEQVYNYRDNTTPKSAAKRESEQGAIAFVGLGFLMLTGFVSYLFVHNEKKYYDEKEARRLNKNKKQESLPKENSRPQKPLKSSFRSSSGIAIDAPSARMAIKHNAKLRQVLHRR